MTSVTPNLVALQKLIIASIEDNPYEHDGHLWCGKSHRQRAKALGLTERTICRLMKNPPFIFDTTIVKGRGRVTLIRIGKPGENTTMRVYAKMMVKVYRAYLAKHIPAQRKKLQTEKTLLRDALDNPSDLEKLDKVLNTFIMFEQLHFLSVEEKLERADERLVKIIKWLLNLRERETNREFGCLRGLAEVWPDGVQVEILQIVFSNWPKFMAYVKFEQDMHRDANRKIKKIDPTAKVTDVRPLFFDYPHIPTIRKYWKVGIEVAQDHYQETGKNPPASFKALNPELWKHLK